MKTLFLLMLAAPFVSAPANAEVVWNGGTGWRYVLQKHDDGLASKDANGRDQSKQTVKTHNVRASLNATEKGETVDWGIGMRTAASNTSEWFTVQGGLDRTVSLESAFFRPHYSLMGGDAAVTIGRAKTVILYDTVAQSLLDNDNRWDGLGWTWKNSMFGLNVTQYVLGAKSGGVVGDSTYSYTEASQKDPNRQSGFGYLFSFQPHVKFKLSDEIEALFALGYHVWSGTGSNLSAGYYTNAVHGGTANSTAGTAVGDVNPVIMDNARQWQVLTDWTLPMNFRFVGEFILNKKVHYGTRPAPLARTAQRSSLGLSLVYGKVKKAHDWSIAYSYVTKGIGSVINTFTFGDVKADNNAHVLDAKYALADGLTIGAKAFVIREKSKLAGDGQPVAQPDQNRRQRQNRYELIGALAF